jgi:hypothetical protein
MFQTPIDKSIRLCYIVHIERNQDMEILLNTNHQPPNGYVLVKDAIDTQGRHHRLAAWPTCGGSVCFFDILSDYVRWVRDVEDIRKMRDGIQTLKERVFQHMITGDMDADIAVRILSV